MRSYKNFDSSKFLADIEKTDWSEVYACIDPEEATKCGTSKFRYTLNIHAPWTRIQQRKTFCPWITAETKNLMKQKDLWKQKAKELAELSEVACPAQIHAWTQYKLSRNQVYNKNKTEESQKVTEVAECPDLVC